MLIGDQNYRDGNIVSDGAIQLLHPIDQFLSTAGSPLETEKITIMSWRDRPSTAHKTKLKSLLLKSPSTIQRDYSNCDRAREPVKGDPSARGTNLSNKNEFDPTKGYLRYRAELERGRIVRVVVRNPPDWHPSLRDLHFIAQRYGKVSKAVVDFWADSCDGPTKEPVVIEEKSSWLPKWPFRWK